MGLRGLGLVELGSFKGIFCKGVFCKGKMVKGIFLEGDFWFTDFEVEGWFVVAMRLVWFVSVQWLRRGWTEWADVLKTVQ